MIIERRSERATERVIIDNDDDKATADDIQGWAKECFPGSVNIR